MIVVSAWHETRRSLLTIFVYPSPDCRPVYTQFSGCCGYTDLPFKAVACRFDLLFGWILAFSRHNYAPPIRTMTFVFSLSLIGGAYHRAGDSLLFICLYAGSEPERISSCSCGRCRAWSSARARARSRLLRGSCGPYRGRCRGWGGPSCRLPWPDWRRLRSRCGAAGR